MSTLDPIRCTVEISLPPATLETLSSQSFELYAWKAVQSSQGEGRPLVWWRAPSLAPRIPLAWTRTYQAFGSHDEIVTRRVVHPVSTPIDLGFTWFIGDTLSGPIEREGADNAVSFSSTAMEAIRVGLAQPVGEEFATYCVFPLNTTFGRLIIPRDTVLLAFSNLPMPEGSVSGRSLANPLGREVEDDSVLASTSPGLLIDLELAGMPEVSVRFDLARGGWDWGGFSWGRQVAINEPLVDVLILDP
ncbi:MAG: hypothetical protein AAGC60_05145 [Acidobacteriota bacterium]